MSSFLVFLSGLKDHLLMFGEIIGIFAGGVAFGVIGALRRKRKDIPKSLFFLSDSKFMNQHTQIHEMLTELRVIVRASRCLIFQFHNGGSFADGSSIKRFSVTHESCSGGTVSMMLDSQDVLLTRYMEMVRILDETPNKIIEVENLPPSTFRSGLEINNVQYFSISPLKCLDTLSLVGFVCCHWCSSDQLDEVEKQGVDQATIEALIADSVRNINTHFSFDFRKK